MIAPKDLTNTKFTIQIGIPTEWSHTKNLKRKRKFENILMGSELLQMKYKTLDKFLQIQANDLIRDVREIYESYEFKTVVDFERRLNELGISVYPETAAGLTFV